MGESDSPETEIEVMRRGASLLAERLPGGWSSRLDVADPRSGIGGLIEVTSAEGRSVTLVAEAKRVVVGRDVGTLRDRLDSMTADIPNRQGLVLARYLSPPVRAKLAEAGLSYIDATGNLRVEIQSPGLFVSDRGADRDPWRGPGRPLGTLKGSPAARIVRAVTDSTGPWTVRELVDLARTSTGSTYRVLDYLYSEGLATRGDDKKFSAPDWVQVLRRWSDEYEFVASNRVTRWIAPRGLPDMMNRIADTDESTRYAVTGTLAAAQWSAYAPARMAMVYVDNAEEAAVRWGLRPTEAGSNVALAEPKIDVVFERSLTNQQGVSLAAPTQVVVDLMTGPGRNPSEAEELLEWMKQNESTWRR